VSKGSRINRNFAESWRGRWESNPTPIAAKLLIPLVHCDWLASNSVQLCSYSLDRFPMRIAHNVTVNLKRGACICVPKLPLDNFRRGTGVEQEQSRVAIYARVSTANNGQDPTMQTRELKEYVERRGWQLAGEYVDVGISGSKEKRPELDRLMADAHRRRFSAVAVWKFDRMARSVSHLLRVLETFGSLGVDFVSLSEAIDTGTPAGKMVFTVLGAVAELERSLIIERVRAGMRNARAKGRRIGRPPQTQLSSELRSDIASAYQFGGTSLRLLAKTFGTSLATVQRCVCVSRTRDGDDFAGPAKNELEPPTR